MRKLIVASLLFFVLFSGCAFLKNQKAAVDACLADTECLQKANEWQNKGEVLGIAVGSAVPVPGAAAAPKIFGYTAFGLALLILGKGVLKKKESTPTG